MQRLLLLLPVLLLSILAHAQTCWDFEQQCSNPSNAFNLGCVPNATAASGTPGLTNSTAVTGTRYCHPTYYSNTVHGQGILLNFAFNAGTKYELKFFIRNSGSLANGDGNNPYVGLHLVNGMSNSGGTIVGNDPCLNTNDLIPAIPAGAQTITRLSSATVGTDWIEQKVIIAPTANFTQLWIRPFINLAELEVNADPVYSIYVDDVCIKEVDCTPEPYTLSICRRGDDGNTLSVTIDGADGVPQSAWKLFPMSKCPNGTPGASQVINWTSDKTFEVPAGTGCFRLFYAWAKPNCPLRIVTQHFSTDDDYYPVCSDCEKWRIKTLLEPCETIAFYAAQNGGFPAGTTFSATLNGNPVFIGTNGSLEYFPQEQGDNVLLYVCITVRQPDCPPVTKCLTYAVADCDGGGWDGSFDPITANPDQGQLQSTSTSALANAEASADEDCVTPDISITVCRDVATGNVGVGINNYLLLPPGGTWSLYYYYINEIGKKVRVDVPFSWKGRYWLHFKDIAGISTYNLAYTWSNGGCSITLPVKVTPTLPNCGENCDTWSIITLTESCESYLFYVQNPTMFPSGTTFTATLNGISVLQSIPGQLEYSPFFQGDNTFITVCFTVNQPGCAPVTKCLGVFIPECGNAPLSADNTNHRSRELATVASHSENGEGKPCDLIEGVNAYTCRLPDGQIQVTIDGFANLPTEGFWTLFYEYTLPNGNTTVSIVNLNWLGASWFSFKPIANEVEYTLAFSYNDDQCVLYFPIINYDDMLTCDEICDNWEIQSEIRPCSDAIFRAISVNSPPFVPGTIVTATLNGNPVQLNAFGELVYNPTLQGSKTWIWVCFTVDKQLCPPVTKCEEYYIPACEAPNDKDLEGRSSDADKAAADALRFTNPADQYILFSQAVENAQVELFTMQGVRVRSISSENIDRVPVADLPNGQYLLSVRQAGGARKTTMILIMHK